MDTTEPAPPRRILFGGIGFDRLAERRSHDTEPAVRRCRCGRWFQTMGPTVLQDQCATCTHNGQRGEVNLSLSGW